MKINLAYYLKVTISGKKSVVMFFKNAENCKKQYRFLISLCKQVAESYQNSGTYFDCEINGIYHAVQINKFPYCDEGHKAGVYDTKELGKFYD